MGRVACLVVFIIFLVLGIMSLLEACSITKIVTIFHEIYLLVLWIKVLLYFMGICFVYIFDKIICNQKNNRDKLNIIQQQIDSNSKNVGDILNSLKEVKGTREQESFRTFKISCPHCQKEFDVEV